MQNLLPVTELTEIKPESKDLPETVKSKRVYKRTFLSLFYLLHFTLLNKRGPGSNLKH